MKPRMPASLALGSGVLLCLLATSCASYTSATRQGFEAFQHRDWDRAESSYSAGADKDGGDQLVYLFDRGTVRNTAGRYEMSIKDFLLADQLSEIKDYTALGSEAASILVNDGVIAYKGEEFEHVLVSVYLALNFAALGKDEEAAVAARKVNRKLELLRDEGKRDYRLNAFAQYMAGALFERLRNWNFAYVDYKKTHEIAPGFTRVRRDMIRGALWMDSSSDLHKYRRILGVTDDEIREVSREMKRTGGIVLLYQNGFAPEKVPSPSWPELPEYRFRFNKHRAARLFLNGEEVARTEILYDVQQAAMANLQQRLAGQIAKRAAGVVTREVIRHQLDQDRPGLGTLVAIGMAAANQADLRSWTTLPKDFQAARVDMPLGRYAATVRLEDIYGGLSEPRDLGEVEIKKAGQVVILQHRSLND